MGIDRRTFIIGSLSTASLATFALSKKPSVEDLMTTKAVGNVTLVFTTDIHARTRPVYFAEPPNLLAPKSLEGTPGFIAGKDWLRYFHVKRGTPLAYVGSSTDFIENAKRYGKTGGLDRVAWIIKRIVEERGRDRVIILDGGDTWVTSTIALLTEGKAIVDWLNYVGYDYIVAHWDVTIGKEKFLQRVKEFKGKFISQNITDEDFGDLIFPPYDVREVGGVKVGIIGQSFPFTPIANPRQFVQGWSFGVKEDTLQKYVDELREKHKVNAVILLSHDGLALDVALAKKVKGIDVILSGHTHDVVPSVIKVDKTLIVIAGSHAKVVGRLDLKIDKDGIKDFSYKLIPVLSDVIPSDKGAKEIIDKYYQPYRDKLSEVIATTDTMLYKRDTLFSTIDVLINMAIVDHYGVDIAQSPGYRWGTTILPGEKITVEDLMDYMAITYPNVWIIRRTGEQIKAAWEDVADNVFNPNPFYQQGGDMSRIYGAEYELMVNAPMGQRIRNIKVKGKDLDPKKTYLVAVWGGPPPPAEILDPNFKPRPVYDVVLEYVRKIKHISIDPRPNVKVLDTKYRLPEEEFGKIRI
ncbi:thiosulfohydrolase SoxB [Thermocrinis minervae]|uniref:Sulfur-oxidizing protein SoxB n=1 Tax=Thermocrinis minervae TaxID=381751 RepID=A0A1M6T882_9AQUI|nr:thiosulfohydrolase SoxB [Thermocrinis minervae]SHK53096.1 sulfur-oxidizing protein SoxB [Thermocrinis minervae]